MTDTALKFTADMDRARRAASEGMVLFGAFIGALCLYNSTWGVDTFSISSHLIGSLYFGWAMGRDSARLHLRLEGCTKTLRMDAVHASPVIHIALILLGCAAVVLCQV